MSGWWLTLRGSYQHRHITLLSGILRDKLKTYLYYYSAYGKQTWQGGVILWAASTYKVTRFFNHMDIWDHVKWLNTTSSLTVDQLPPNMAK